MSASNHDEPLAPVQPAARQPYHGPLVETSSRPALRLSWAVWALLLLIALLVLPTLVERQVRAEIERVVGRAVS